MIEMQDNQICTSILCTTFNHAKYIAQTLDGILNQNTTFKYEVIIHDDASTDSTPEIIKEYSQNYPDIIIPIIQKENLYSKGIRIISEILLPKARGKYIAFCEGDDYWIDSSKLQKQVIYLESHPSCTFSFTNGIVDSNGIKSKHKVVIPWTKYSSYKFKPDKSIYYLSDLTEILGYIPTASFVMRRDILLGIPKLSASSFSGDQYWALYCTSMGYAYFINEMMCAYRTNVSNSATDSWRKIVKKNGLPHPISAKFLSLYDEFDEITDFKYKKDLEILRVIHSINYAFEIHDYNYFQKDIVKEYIRNSGFKMRIRLILLKVPVVEKFVLFMYQKLKRMKTIIHV